MKHLILDTGIFRKSPRLDSPEFKSLSYLSRKKCVRIHVPYVVEREFSTQLGHDQKRRISTAIKSLKDAIRHAPLGEKTSIIPEIVKTLEENADGIIGERSAAFIAWIDEVGGRRHALNIKEATSALEAYFNGLPPLKEPKVRKDIPDAFIFQCVLRLKSEYNDELAVIIEDGALRGACESAGIEIFTSLSAYLASDTAQECLAEKVIDDNLDDVLSKVTAISQDLETQLAGAIEAELLHDNYRLLSGGSLPGESNEIYVSGVSTPTNIELGEFEHLGAGVFVANFTAKVEFLYEYAVEISEAIDLDRDRFYVEPLNDHYMNVETSDEFEFVGRVELDFGEAVLSFKTKAKLLEALEDPHISADELGDFVVIS